MEYIHRLLEREIDRHLGRGKSLLILGPRQTGKTTLLLRMKPDLYLSLASPADRHRYEKNPALLEGEAVALKGRSRKAPLIIVDEVQKVPALMDVAQHLIDAKVAQLILTGSSARKLRRGGSVNLLPGRVVALHLDPLMIQEATGIDLETALLDGTLPGIFGEKKPANREIDLKSYVETYLEEEVRSEALVRQIGSFARFLEYAGLESGKTVSFRALSQELGISHTTIAAYFEVLEDCLVAERVDPVTKSLTRKKLTKSSRHLIFDMGVRRLCADEGAKPSPARMGELFEQYVGLELIRNARMSPSTKIRFWRDPDGPEVDWVIERDRRFVPVEVKWSAAPSARDARHVGVFLSEYAEAKEGFVVCRTPRPFVLDKNITAIPWRDIPKLFR